VKYHYTLATDPEPTHVRRVQTVHRDPELGYYRGDVWTKTPCERRVGNVVYVNWPRPDHGRAHRSLPKKGWRADRKILRHAVCDGDHWHWFNGDRYRAWGNFRGFTGEVIDLDAFSRTRTMYRRRRR
jgi:hypothetical protein